MAGEAQVVAKRLNAEIASPAFAGAGFATLLAMTGMGDEPIMQDKANFQKAK